MRNAQFTKKRKGRDPAARFTTANGRYVVRGCIFLVHGRQLRYYYFPPRHWEGTYIQCRLHTFYDRPYTCLRSSLHVLRFQIVRAREKFHFSATGRRTETCGRDEKFRGTISRRN